MASGCGIIKIQNGNEYDLYLTDEYLKKNPNLSQEHSKWKIMKIIPLIDEFMLQHKKKEINLLDVGGGAGLILKEISKYLENTYKIKVNKFAIDLSPGILKIQKKNNPDLKQALNEDITHTSLKDKEIDITLMIDVLEHVKDPKAVLFELKRISRFVLFKVPLENNTFYNVTKLITKNRSKYLIEEIGHIQTYDIKKLKSEITLCDHDIICYYYTNYPKYAFNSSNNIISKITYLIAIFFYKISPRISSRLFLEFAMVLSRC